MNIQEKKIHLDIDFPEIKGHPTVFIDKIVLGKSELETLHSSIPRELYIFGAIVKTDEIRLNKLEEVKKLEFIVVEKKIETNELIHHHLSQCGRSIMYQRDIDITEGESVDMLKKKDILYLNHLPRWKASAATIPKYRDKLFHFCSQIYFQKNISKYLL